MNGWFIIVWATIMLAAGLGTIALEVNGWQPSGHYASTHDDPSPGPNALF